MMSLNISVILLMLTPAVLFFLLFAYVPMAGIIIAFKHYDYAGGIFGSPWNGLDNIRFFLNQEMLGGSQGIRRYIILPLLL